MTKLNYDMMSNMQKTNKHFTRSCQNVYLKGAQHVEMCLPTSGLLILAYW